MLNKLKSPLFKSKIQAFRADASNIQPRLSIADEKELPSKHEPNLVGFTDDTVNKLPWWTFCYNKHKKTVCDRTFTSWVLIITYAIMYLIFLSTFTMLCLFGSLTIIKYTEVYYSFVDRSDFYSDNDVIHDLNAAPLTQTSPLIWYREGDREQYQKYIKALDELLNRDFNTTVRVKRNVRDLGPCGVRPYGYGEQPCILVEINKKVGRFGKPLEENSPLGSIAPKEVRKWLRLKPQKLWLHCHGSYPWDREHLGVIKYYPDPPGFDPGSYPQNETGQSPLVAIQLSNFTLGLSISIHCKLWHNLGPSSLNFVLYVAPQRTL